MDKIFETRSPESICEGSSFSTEADLGLLTDVQELIIAAFHRFVRNRA